VNTPLEIRKVIIGVVLAMFWVSLFLFFNPNLAIQWTQSTTNLTFLKPIVIGIMFLVIVFYHLFNKAHSETNKLSWTAVLTVCWLALILFYPFKDPSNYNGGAVGFFALIGGLAVAVLWVRFFSDEIVMA
jgi:quinol-cytochrome oxidoreductase complex cytochrome b subunit